MMKISVILVLVSLAVITLADTRVPQHGLVHQIKKGVAGPNPYIFLTVPKGRSQSLVQAFEVIEENDNKKPAANEETEEEDETDIADEETMQVNENNDNEDEDVDEDNQQLDNNNEDVDEDNDNINDELDNVMSINLKLRKSNAQIKNAKPTPMMVSRNNAGAILVPDDIIEIEAQTVIDEKTGKPALLVPRAILDSIPDGSVVALMQRSDESEDTAEERANRVIVRRRRKGAHRNIKRSRGGNKRRVLILDSRRLRRGYKQQNVRLIRGEKQSGNRVAIRRGSNLRGVNKRRINRRRVSL